MKHGKNNYNYRHGMCHTSFYGVWKQMKYRCSNPNDKRYHRYGGRGIRYDPRWKDFIPFMEDMYELYLEACKKWTDEVVSIDRKNNNGNYTKENCRWIPMRQNKHHTMPQNYAKSKPVERQLEDGSWERFPSMMQAERDTGISNGDICYACKGKRKTAGGHRWRYAKK